jgi:hypothetical protein
MVVKKTRNKLPACVPSILEKNFGAWGCQESLTVDLIFPIGRLRVLGACGIVLSYGDFGGGQSLSKTSARRSNMQRNGVDKLVGKWLNEPGFREKMKKDPEGTVASCGISLNAEEWATVSNVVMNTTDKYLKKRVSKTPLK